MKPPPAVVRGQARPGCRPCLDLRAWSWPALVPVLVLVLIGLIAIPDLSAEPADAAPAAALAPAPAPAPAPALADGLQTIDSALDVATLEARLAAAEDNAALGAEARTRLVEQYRAALADLTRMAEANAAALAFREALDEAPAQTAAIRARLDRAGPLPDPPEPPVTLDADTDLAEIERLLAREQAEVSALEVRLATLRAELDETAAQLPNQRWRLAEARQEVADVEAELAQALPRQRDGDEAQARVLALEARRDALQAEALMLDQQLLSAGVRRALKEARLDETAFQLARSQARRDWLQAQVEQRRRAEAEQVQAETEAAKEAAADAHPLVRALAQENAALAAANHRRIERVEATEAEHAQIEQAVARVDQEFRNARARLDAAGLNHALGRMLIDQREQLPDLRELRRDARLRAGAIADVTLNQLRHRDELRELQTGAEAADAELLAGLPAAEAAALAAQLAEQRARREDLLRRALASEERYLRALTEQDVAAAQLQHLVRDYQAFLAERLLWVRSHVPINEQDFTGLHATLPWLTDPANWRQVMRLLAFEAARPSLLWLGLLVVVGLLVWQRRLRRALRASAEPLRRVSSDRFSWTLIALGQTLVLAAPWPLLLWLLGHVLAASLAADPFTKAIGDGLLAIALPAYYLRAFRLLCLPGGVADRHFRWHVDTLRRVRRSADLAVYGLLPLGFLAVAIDHQGDPVFEATLGRLVLTAFLFGFAGLLAWALHPTRGTLHRALAGQPVGLLNRSRFLWYPLAIGVPLSLAGLVLAGFQYTASVLLASIINQLWLGLVLVVVQQSIVRWLLVTRRGLALKATLARRTSREAQPAAVAGEAGSAAEAQPMVDFAALDQQTRQLVNALLTIGATVGLWLVWSDVLPALNLANHITLWRTSTELDGITKSVPVTLANLGEMLIIVAVAAVAARNLPALIEILLLKNSRMSVGGRYTITTLTRYVIVAVATVMVLGALGLNWGQVQWLVAALGVGIGFGLQEIVANFISGLIILFERPVRVGDTVTVGDATGVVTNIEIRAVTIRTLDRQELLVPNKEFVTGRLLNWTLSDAVNRVTIPVSIDYGSDADHAMALLAEVAAGHPRVLADPAPIITFEAFGERGRGLVLRCFLDTVDKRLVIVSDLYRGIDARFREAGIAITFPRHEVHLHGVPPPGVDLGKQVSPAGIST